MSLGAATLCGGSSLDTRTGRQQAWSGGRDPAIHIDLHADGNMSTDRVFRGAPCVSG